MRAETVTRDHRVDRRAVDDDLPPLSVDPPSIAEVVYILLDNASKYSPVGTTITVRATADDDRHVRITVADQGPGITAELRERVFEKFFRVPARESHDPRRGGIGLGLPIAQAARRGANGTDLDRNAALGPRHTRNHDAAGRRVDRRRTDAGRWWRAGALNGEEYGDRL